MNESRDLVQRLEGKPHCPTVMADSFSATARCPVRMPRAISSVAGRFPASSFGPGYTAGPFSGTRTTRRMTEATPRGKSHRTLG
jgi:hypothetical protein